MPLQYPPRNRAVELRKVSRKEVISAFNDGHLCLLAYPRRKLLDHCAQHIRRAEPIEFACKQKLGLLAAIKVGKAAASEVANRQPKSDELFHARITAPGAQADPGSKTKARDQQRHTGKFPCEKINRGQNITVLSDTFVMLSFAMAHSAKIEAHHGQPKAVDRFCGLVDHFVVHRSAK